MLFINKQKTKNHMFTIDRMLD